MADYFPVSPKQLSDFIAAHQAEEERKELEAERRAGKRRS